MSLEQKLRILSDEAKYDVSCATSGAVRSPVKDGIGHSDGRSICHSFTLDGRCVALLKILLTNHCVYDCVFCVNRASSDIARACFTPEEVAHVTIEMYKRNYIEGLFLSSGIFRTQLRRYCGLPSMAGSRNHGITSVRCCVPWCFRVESALRIRVSPERHARGMAYGLRHRSHFAHVSSGSRSSGEAGSS